ncbi:MAG: hypothetical protein A3D67_02145 [Candidatus Lloydbacteria bacterium RIFCSPHIGHO2_02_FULL_51_22]|uniref:Proline dehydrogenase domain-containing protein n=2 Tax=Candidatus Lloydiibacteriota TaxID=1817910 RepID=A0A1G2D8A1_9BACT|nr:MAG: hypothetical protein A3D67_02145 [Candidatus Lloydbacteria bacterium RIFCSPHIGHO2_02_FULL_51_22]OGZ15023.1 MAG: hypothetical protein A3J08_01600 [Candidatus Lloydbacteria bacterium RIFCSPLOWO2_02_FULL_51_11]
MREPGQLSYGALSQKVDEALPQVLKDIHTHTDRYSPAAMLLRSVAHDKALQAGVLRFVDCLPALSSGADIYEHYRQFVLPHIAALSHALRVLAQCAALPVIRAPAMHALRALIHRAVAPYFIVPDETALCAVMKTYEREGAEVSVDFLGELVVSWKEADAYLAAYVNAMKTHGGHKKPFHISVKFSALYPFLSPENREESIRELTVRFSALLHVAEATNSFVTVDAEMHSVQGIIEDVFVRTVCAPRFRGAPRIGIALQANKKGSYGTAERLASAAKDRGTPFLIRLVKGAYLETETAVAEQKNWPSPVWSEKRETDENWNRICAFLAERWGTVHLSPGTHNPANILYAEECARACGFLHDERFFFQVLYGLGEPIRKMLRARERRVLIYTPVGNLLQGMAYLARRILENTSNQNFLYTLIS